MDRGEIAFLPLLISQALDDVRVEIFTLAKFGCSAVLGNPVEVRLCRYPITIAILVNELGLVTETAERIAEVGYRFPRLHATETNCPIIDARVFGVGSGCSAEIQRP